MLASVRDSVRSLEPVPSLHLQALGDRIRYGFFTRKGGGSSGIYAGLNAGIGSSDSRQAVSQNRKLMTDYLGVSPQMLACPYQVHSSDAIVVSRPFEKERPEADGVVTAKSGLAVGVVTADCGPILFVDPVAGVVAAAHAGWRGALEGILENTVAAMVNTGARPEDTIAVLGPTISQGNYEVGPELVRQFIDRNPQNARFFEPSERKGRMMFDLIGFILARLRETGCTAESVGYCTYGDEDRFYSYRRSTHRGESDYGRQLSAIVLRDI